MTESAQILHFKMLTEKLCECIYNISQFTWQRSENNNNKLTATIIIKKYVYTFSFFLRRIKMCTLDTTTTYNTSFYLYIYIHTHAILLLFIKPSSLLYFKNAANINQHSPVMPFLFTYLSFSLFINRFSPTKQNINIDFQAVGFY